MAGTTPKRLLPYPSNADTPNVAGDINALATATDTKLGSAGVTVIGTVQTRALTSYATLTTPDQVTGIVLPTNGLIFVGYKALWKATGSPGQLGKAAVFLGSNQLKGPAVAAPSVVQETTVATVGDYSHLSTAPQGLIAAAQTASAGAADVTTGQILASTAAIGGFVTIFAAAGTYTVSVQFAVDNVSATVSVKERYLWVWTQPF